MNPPTGSKPKCKFSSRNLNAVFKAPIGTKPLPDNATGPLQRSTNHMLVLGKASVTPPAPLNTPSLKSESKVNDVHVSLVPAGSNWAKNAEKCMQNEELERSPVAVNATASSTVLEKVWTPESVAEHLHTSRFVARPIVAVKNSGRWGDDAVEDDIVQNNIRRRLQKEREFPDLKKALEETQTYRGHGHVSTAGEMQLMRPRQEPEQRHGRATGRWAHFNKEEMHHSMQDTGSRWSHSQYERDEDDRWSRDQSRFGAYGLESRRHENVGWSDPNDCHAHFSRSDVRFDIVASGNGDRVMNHSPHRMNWGTTPLSHRDASLPSVSSNEDSCVQTLQPFRSSSPPPVLASGSIAVKLASKREDDGPGHARENYQCTNIVWSENEELSTSVAEEMQSSTESSSNSLSHSSPGPPQQLKLFKRPKMLFDPRTGGIVNAEDMTRPDKRQTDGCSGDKDRVNTVRKSKTSGSIRASKRTNCKREAQAQASTSKSKSGRAGRKEANLTPENVDAGSSISQTAIVAIEQEAVVNGTACTSETSPMTSSNAVELMADQADIKVASKGRRVKRDSKRVTTKQPFRQEGKSRVTKPPQESRPSTSLTTRLKQQHRNSRDNTAVNVRGCSTASSGNVTDCIKYNILMQCDGRKAVGAKLVQHEREMQKPNLDHTGHILLTSTALGPNSGVVMQSDEQQDFKVSSVDGGFETVKSRRDVLFEKKQLRERVITTVAVAPLLDERKRDCASLEVQAAVPSKEVQEKKLCMVAKVSEVATPPETLRLRDKAVNSRRSANEVIKDKKTKTKCVSKQATGTRGSKKKEMPAKAKVPVCGSHSEMPEQVALRSTEQVAGEAPIEASLLKKSTKGTKATVKLKKNRQSDEMCKTNDPKRVSNIASTSRQQDQSRRQGTKQSAHSGVQSVGSVTTQPRESGGITAKRKAKQVRQVYVVKTLAPAPVSATFTTV
ncbi:hypothetical protein DD237_002215 [Peronospora effusa]|uniref:BAT2 N-terminal domain-containing protein n=1 Tax=Peronospora effusa TaxID=542832 RepID=A0A425CLP1_9STRA|nr:hypothetical protein DD237_002215 [Peronospora effusa]